MYLKNRIYFLSQNVTVRDDPSFDGPVLEYKEGCSPEEINEALKHCNMEIVSQRQRIQRLYTLRRKNGERSEEHTDDSTRAVEGV